MLKGKNPRIGQDFNKSFMLCLCNIIKNMFTLLESVFQSCILSYFLLKIVVHYCALFQASAHTSTFFPRILYHFSLIVYHFFSNLVSFYHRALTQLFPKSFFDRQFILCLVQICGHRYQILKGCGRGKFFSQYLPAAEL